VDHPISLLLIREYAVVRIGLMAYLGDTPSIATVEQVDSIDKSLELLANDNTDVAIVDLALLKPSGLSAIRQLLKVDPGIKIIVLSCNEREPFITQCIENGALGYLSLGCTQAELIEANPAQLTAYSPTTNPFAVPSSVGWLRSFSPFA
jgi:DNA-binding NarL/FixJ family response regulator